MYDSNILNIAKVKKNNRLISYPKSSDFGINKILKGYLFIEIIPQKNGYNLFRNQVTNQKNY